MKDYGLQPLGDRILVLQDRAPEKSEGGVLIAVVAQERPFEGTVVRLGTAERFYVKAGDRVLFASWTGQELQEGQAAGDRLLVMRESELLVARDRVEASETRTNGAAVKAARGPVRA